ncbi:unnamed protein product [Laminaria digitata]
MAACGNGGQWERSLTVLAEISAAGLTPTLASYNIAVAACSRAGQWERAVGLLGEMRAAGVEPVSSTFLPAIEACGRAGEARLAYSLTRERDAAQREARRMGRFKFKPKRRDDVGKGGNGRDG